MKSNIKIWLILIVLVPIISGLYGIVHDQITFSISSEYFTHFKFIQFNIAENLRDSERLATAIVGFLSTWWVGVILAVLLGIIGLQKMSVEHYRKSRVQAVKIVFLMTIVFGVIGYFLGLYSVASTSDWPKNIGSFEGMGLPDIRAWDNFMIVGSIHNFSYLGALVGLIVALVKQFRLLKRS